MTKNELINRFNAWIALEYTRMRERFSVAESFDEDCYHDAYICVMSAICKNDMVYNFKDAFIQAYQKRKKIHISETYAIFHPEEQYFNRLSDKTAGKIEEHQTQQDESRLINNIRQYVKYKYSWNYVKIWESRTFRNMPYRDIMSIFGIGYKRAAAIVDMINRDIRQNFAFTI